MWTSHIERGRPGGKANLSHGIVPTTNCLLCSPEEVRVCKDHHRVSCCDSHVIFWVLRACGIGERGRRGKRREREKERREEREEEREGGEGREEGGGRWKGEGKGGGRVGKEGKRD